MKCLLILLTVLVSLLSACSLDRTNPLDPKNDANITIPEEVSILRNEIRIAPSTASPRWIELRWTEKMSVDGYYLYRALSPHSHFERIRTIEDNRIDFHRDSNNIRGGTTYWYRISAFIDYTDYINDGNTWILEGNVSEMIGVEVFN